MVRILGLALCLALVPACSKKEQAGEDAAAKVAEVVDVAVDVAADASATDVPAVVTPAAPAADATVSVAADVTPVG